MLNVRPPIADEETISSYVQRVAEANHCETTGWLVDGLAHSAESLGQDVAAIEKLAAMVDVPAEVLLRHAYVTEGRLVRHGEHLLPKDALRLRHRRVCPGCLSERPVLRWWWDLAPLRACPEHRLALMDRCPGCEKPLRASTPSVVRCGCGYDLRCAAHQAASPDAINVASGFLALARGGRSGAFERLPSYVGLGEALEICGVVARLQLLASAQKPVRGSVLRRPDIADLMPDVFEVLRRWPGSLVEVLEAVIERRARKKNDQEAVMRPFYNALRNAHLTGTRTALIDASREFLQKRFRTLPLGFAPGGDTLLKREEAEQLLRSQDHDGQPLYDYHARSFWDRHGRKLHVYRDSRENFYARSELLRVAAQAKQEAPYAGQCRGKGGSASVGISLSGPRFRGNQYRRIRADKGQVSLTHSQLADQLGTSIGIARSMAQSGRFESNGLAVHPSLVESWIVFLSRKLAGRSPNMDGVSYREWRDKAFSIGLEETEIIRFIENVPFLNTEGPVSLKLDEVYVPRDEVDRVINEYTATTETKMNRQDVERELALLPQEFDSLRRNGFFGDDMVGCRLERGCLVPVGAVDHFRRRYVARRALRLPSYRHTPVDIFKTGMDLERATAACVHQKLRVFYRDSLDLTFICASTGAVV